MCPIYTSVRGAELPAKVELKAHCSVHLETVPVVPSRRDLLRFHNSLRRLQVLLLSAGLFANQSTSPRRQDIPLEHGIYYKPFDMIGAFGVALVVIVASCGFCAVLYRRLQSLLASSTLTISIMVYLIMPSAAFGTNMSREE